MALPRTYEVLDVLQAVSKLPLSFGQVCCKHDSKGDAMSLLQMHLALPTLDEAVRDS